MIAAANKATTTFFEDSLEFVVNELFMAVADDGNFKIGCHVNGNPHAKDWIGLFKSPADDQNEVADGNWLHIKPGDNLLNTITPAELGEYEARYYAFQSRGRFGWGSNYQLISRTGPLNRVVAK